MLPIGSVQLPINSTYRCDGLGGLDTALLGRLLLGMQLHRNSTHLAHETYSTERSALNQT